MLRPWLECIEVGDSPYEGFYLLNVAASGELTEDMLDNLVSMVKTARISISLVSKMEQKLGWTRAQKIVANLMPHRAAIKRGDFGEILTQAILTEMQGYVVPLSKLQFKVIAEDTLHGTDIVALKLDDKGVIQEFCYVEAKLRTTRETMVAVEAHDQLCKDYAQELPYIVVFLASQLETRNPELLDAVLTYMRDRQDNRDKDTFRISLCWENSTWRDDVLANLDDKGVELAPLYVYVIRIDGLKQLTDSVFARLGIVEVQDNDDEEK